MLTVLALGLAHAATITVDDDAPADYTSIQDAIDNASPGDVIQVAAGTYTELATDPNDARYAFGLWLHGDITIEGAGPEQTIVTMDTVSRERIGCMGVRGSHTDAVVRGLTCVAPTGGTNNSTYAYAAFTEGPQVGTSDISFYNVVFSLPESRAKVILYHNDANRYVHFENVVVDFGTSATQGSFNYSNTGNHTLSMYNSIVVNTNAYRYRDGTEWDLQYSLTWPAAPQGGTNISGDPLFTGLAGTLYTLEAGSPAIDAGNPDPSYNDLDGSRNNMGVYGGSGGLIPPTVCPGTHTTVPVASGGNACIHPTAEVHETVGLSNGVFVDERAIVAARASLGAGAHIHADAILGRRTQIGAGSDVRNEAILGRAVQVGAGSDIGGNTAIGYGSILGSNVTIGANAILGTLVNVGADSEIGTTDVVTMARQATVGTNAQIAGLGVMGPECILGDRFIATGGFRMRKQVDGGDDVTLGDNVRVGRDADLATNTTLQDDVTIGASACISGTVTTGTVLARNAFCP